jgi:hypothetical protein
MRSVHLMLALASLALAQEGMIRGPVSGVIFDAATSSVRALLGVPGAAYFSAPIAAGLDNAFVSPDGAWILASRGGSVFSIARTGGEERRIAEGSLTSAAFTRDSARAALVASGRVLLLQRRDGVLLELGATPGDVAALTVDRTGRQVFAAVSGDHGGVYRFAEDEPIKELARLSDPRGLALGEGALFVLDRAAGQVLEIRDLDQGGAVIFAAGFAEATGLALTPDGNLVMVTDAATRTVSLFDRAGAARSRVELNFTPSRLEHAGDSPLFLLNHRDAKHPLEVLALRPEPASYFVPAPEED